MSIQAVEKVLKELEVESLVERLKLDVVREKKREPEDRTSDGLLQVLRYKLEQTKEGPDLEKFKTYQWRFLNEYVQERTTSISIEGNRQGRPPNHHPRNIWPP